MRGQLLTERDTKVVLDVYKYRYLSVSQIQRLHFPSLQTAYRRLRSLTDNKYLVGFTAPNIPEHMYYLGPPGAEVAAVALGLAASDLKWKESSRAPKDYYFLQHFLKVNDFRIGLSRACQQSDLSLLGFIPEYYGHKTADGGLAKYIKDFVCDVQHDGRTLNHTPDAVFALAKNASPALFFLEIDRGTEVISDPEKGVLKTLTFYLNYLLSGKYQRYSQDFSCPAFKGFRALFVTTAEARLENVRQIISQVPVVDKAKKFIWLTTDSRLAAASVFEPIWRTADAGDPGFYRIG